MFAEIAKSAKQVSGVSEVTPSTRLYKDLGLTGEDAEEFMSRFAGAFDVDMTSFVWLRYFNDEGMDMLGPALALGASVLSPSFAVRWQAAHDAEREITLAHLVDVARAKVWSDPGEAFRRAPSLMSLTLIFSAISVLVTGGFFFLGLVITYAFLTGQLGEQNVLTLIGIAATSLFFPAYLAWLGWHKIQNKLASADRG